MIIHAQQIFTITVSNHAESPILGPFFAESDIGEQQLADYREWLSTNSNFGAERREALFSTIFPRLDERNFGAGAVSDRPYAAGYVAWLLSERFIRFAPCKHIDLTEVKEGDEVRVDVRLSERSSYPATWRGLLSGQLHSEF